MRRREFITLLGGAAVAWPLAAHARQPVTPVIGFLSSRSPVDSADAVSAFRKGLRQIGFIEGQNVVIAFRWAEGLYDRLPALASDLANLPVAVLFAAGGSPSALAAKSATSKIPIVFLTGDPLKLGLVPSLDHPGGNVTGISNLSAELPGKSIGILKQFVPAGSAIAYLVNPSNPIADLYTTGASVAADSLGIQLHVLKASTSRDLDEVFATLADLRIRALGIMADGLFDSQRERVVELAARHAIAGCYPWREYVLAGGLFSYGTALPESYRQAGIYAGRILKGENPSDLPVMQSTKFELVINLKTAKALGLDVPPNLLAIADEVIE